MIFTLPSSEAKIEVTNLVSGEVNNYWNSDYKVVDKESDVISSQEFIGVACYVPTEESNKELYIAQHLQTYVYDGLIWLAAITASQSE